MADPPLIDHIEPQPWGTPTIRTVRLHGYLRHPDGREQARVSYDDVSGTIRWTCDLDELVERPGVEYGRVPVEQFVPEQRDGRVATVHDWRRTG